MSLEAWILDATRDRPVTRELSIAEWDAIAYVVWADAGRGWSPATNPVGRTEAIEQARKLAGSGTEVKIRRAPREWEAEQRRQKARHEYP
jgi:hypothetical protein